MDEKELKELTASVLKELGPAIGAAVKPVVEELVKPLADNQKILADTMTADRKAAEAAQAAGAGKAGEKKEGAAAAAGTLTLTDEEFNRRVEAKANELIDGKLKARDTTAEAAKRKAELRDRVIEAKGLKGVPARLVSLPDTEDEAALNAAADELRTTLNGLNVKLPDVGGASKDGGKTAGEQNAAQGGGGFLKMAAGAAPAQ